MADEQIEEALAQRMPVTHAAFQKHGRVVP